MKNKYNFDSEVKAYNAGESGSWYFATLPKDIANEINFLYSERKKGWGSLKIKVGIDLLKWDTSIFPDKKSGSYLLPIKASVRKSIDIANNKKFHFEIEII